MISHQITVVGMKFFDKAPDFLQNKSLSFRTEPLN